MFLRLTVLNRTLLCRGAKLLENQLMMKTAKFSPEDREQAARLVLEHCCDYPSLWAAIESIAPKIGCVPKTLSMWVRRYEMKTGSRIRFSALERVRILALECEVRELRRANEVLTKACGFIIQKELDRILKS